MIYLRVVLWYNCMRKRGRVVEGARLEIVWARKGLGGSNPLASATALVSRFFRIRTFGANPLASATHLTMRFKK